MEQVFWNIRAECARIGLTTTGFCEEMKVPKKTWYRWMEKGDFPTSVLVRISKYLRISTDTLLGITFDN